MTAHKQYSFFAGLCKALSCLYSSTGTAARITNHSETQDRHIEIVPTGVCRFDNSEEPTSLRGYRLIKPDWQDFTGRVHAQSDRKLIQTRLVAQVTAPANRRAQPDPAP